MKYKNPVQAELEQKRENARVLTFAVFFAFIHSRVTEPFVTFLNNFTAVINLIIWC